MAQDYIYTQLHAQASVLAYVDIIRYLTVFCGCMIPLLFLIPRPPQKRRSQRRPLGLFA